MEDNDAQLQLKKRARRRLVGAVAFAGFAAVVLPMIMDQEPKQATQDVEIRIPGQDEKPFAPKFSSVPAPAAVPEAKVTPPVVATAVSPVAVKPAENASEKPSEKPSVKATEKALAKPSEKLVEKPVDKPAEKTTEKTVAKPADKTAEAPVKAGADSQRAVAILAGKAPEATGSQHVILIGAFNSQANVKNLQSKLSELGIRIYTEPLDTPQGKKTRVRAGPFPSREAAEKALEKMKRIGVDGVLTAKQ